MSKKEHKKLQDLVNTKGKQRAKAVKGSIVSGKGDTPRPMDLDKYRDNFDKIFRNNTLDEVLKKPGGEDLVKEELEGFRKNKREIKVIKTYVDNNNVTMYVVNINNSNTNRTITEAKYLSLSNESNRDDIIDIPSDSDIDEV